MRESKLRDMISHLFVTGELYIAAQTMMHRNYHLLKTRSPICIFKQLIDGSAFFHAEYKTVAKIKHPVNWIKFKYFDETINKIGNWVSNDTIDFIIWKKISWYIFKIFSNKF